MNEKEGQSKADKREALKLSLLDLENNVANINSKGRKMHWYGKRLLMLRLYYNLSVDNLIFLLNIKHLKETTIQGYISRWETNTEKPDDKIIDKLCFIFEVEERFFTNDEIIIKFREQLKIELCDHKLK